MSTSTTLSVAKRLAAVCSDGTVYVTTNLAHEGFPGAMVVRVYGNSQDGNGPVGLWQLLTDDEVAELGVEAYRFSGGGLIVRKDNRRYATAQALAVSVWRLLGKMTGPKSYPNVVFL